MRTHALKGRNPHVLLLLAILLALSLQTKYGTILRSANEPRNTKSVLREEEKADEVEEDGERFLHPEEEKHGGLHPEEKAELGEVDVPAFDDYLAIARAASTSLGFNLRQGALKKLQFWPNGLQHDHDRTCRSADSRGPSWPRYTCPASGSRAANTDDWTAPEV